MSQLLKIDDEYRCWIAELGKHFHQGQIKAETKIQAQLVPEIVLRNNC